MGVGDRDITVVRVAHIGADHHREPTISWLLACDDWVPGRLRIDPSQVQSHNRGSAATTATSHPDQNFLGWLR